MSDTMGRRKTTISGSSSYREIGEFWDEHDLADYWDQMHEVEMNVDIKLVGEERRFVFSRKKS